MMKKILLIFSLLLLFCNNMNAQKRYDLDWNARGYGDKAKISWATVHADGWHQWWKYIKAVNRTDKDLMFEITFRICRVKALSRKDKLSDKNCSEITTLYKYMPAHTTVKLFDPQIRTEEQLPYLKPVANLGWGFDIIDFKVSEP